MNLMQLPDAKRQVSESYVNIILIWKLNTNNKIIPSPSLLPGHYAIIKGREEGREEDSSLHAGSTG